MDKLISVAAITMCPRACNYVYDPICAYNGVEYKLFGNQCFMDGYNDCDRLDGAAEYYAVTEDKCNGIQEWKIGMSKLMVLK